MELRSGNVIARVAGGLRIVDPFYGIWTDGKGEGYSALREAQINRMKIRSNENSKLEMYIFIYTDVKVDFQLVNDGRILTVERQRTKRFSMH